MWKELGERKKGGRGRALINVNFRPSREGRINYPSSNRVYSTVDTEEDNKNQIHSMIIINIHEDTDSNHNILYKKSDSCIPRNETVRPRSQFLNIHVSVSDLYISRIGLPIWLQQIGRPVVGIYKSLRYGT